MLQGVVGKRFLVAALPLAGALGLAAPLERSVELLLGALWLLVEGARRAAVGPDTEAVGAPTLASARSPEPVAPSAETVEREPGETAWIPKGASTACGWVAVTARVDVEKP